MIIERQVSKLIGDALLEATKNNEVNYKMPVEYYLSIISPIMSAASEEDVTDDQKFEKFKSDCAEHSIVDWFNTVMAIIESPIPMEQQQLIINQFAQQLVKL